MACKLDGLLGLINGYEVFGDKIGKGVVKDGCGRGSEEESQVNILRGRVSLCDALWGSRQGIDGDGEAPTATILGAMAAGRHSTAAASHPTTSLQSHS